MFNAVGVLQISNIFNSAQYFLQFISFIPMLQNLETNKLIGALDFKKKYCHNYKNPLCLKKIQYRWEFRFPTQEQNKKTEHPTS